MSEFRRQTKWQKKVEDVQCKVYDVLENIVETPQVTNLFANLESLFNKNIIYRQFGKCQQAYVDSIGSNNMTRLAEKTHPIILVPGVFSQKTGERLAKFGKQINPNTGVVIFDLNRNSVNIAKHGEGGNKYFQADATDLPVAHKSVDLIISEGLLSSLSGDRDNFKKLEEDRTKVLVNLANTLNHGGIMLLEDNRGQFDPRKVDKMRLVLGDQFEIAVLNDPRIITQPKLYDNFSINNGVASNFLKTNKSEAILRVRRVGE